MEVYRDRVLLRRLVYRVLVQFPLNKLLDFWTVVLKENPLWSPLWSESSGLTFPYSDSIMSSRRRFELCIAQAIIDPILQSENLENRVSSSYVRDCDVRSIHSVSERLKGEFEDLLLTQVLWSVHSGLPSSSFVWFHSSEHLKSNQVYVALKSTKKKLGL